MRVLDSEIVALYALRRPLTSALRLRADPEKSARLLHIEEQIDAREAEYERLGKIVDDQERKLGA
jgi:hypothetical protein